MKTNKIRPKFNLLTKIETKNDSLCVFILLFTVSLLLEPFGSRLIYRRYKDMGWLASLKPTVPDQSSINPLKIVLYNSPKLPLKGLPIIFRYILQYASGILRFHHNRRRKAWFYTFSIWVFFLAMPIECFHSRCQHLCKFIGTKESVYVRKEFNSHRIGLGHQHGRRFIVLGHKYGRHDVMWKHTITGKLEVT